MHLGLTKIHTFPIEYNDIEPTKLKNSKVNILIALDQDAIVENIM